MFSSISRKIEKKHLFLVGFKLYYNQDTKGQNYTLNIDWNSILLVETAIKNNWTYVVDIFMSFIFHWAQYWKFISETKSFGLKIDSNSMITDIVYPT